MKRQLLTLCLKHDTEFKTLSKIALSQLLLKIILLQKNGTSYRQINHELNNVIIGSINKKDVDAAIKLLEKEEKIHQKNDRYFIHQKYQGIINDAVKQNETLHNKILLKYFKEAESKQEIIKIWFQDTTIKFFERFSVEWFQQVSHNGKNSNNLVPDIDEIIIETLHETKGINEADFQWLTKRYREFLNSEDTDDNLLFWHYGISMFSSRLITARNYADNYVIDLFKDSKLVLDTNVLMILDLEEYDLNDSLASLENILYDLNITPGYFYVTRDEYIRAMDFRKNETLNVWREYDFNVLKESDCPFIKTAIKRNCKSEEDINKFFDSLMDLPVKFKNHLALQVFDDSEINEAVLQGENDDSLKSKINEIYNKRTKREKRPNPLSHDAGLIKGTNLLRRKHKTWIITNDSTLKIYALENCIRDENEIAIGLDVLIGMMAVQGGGANIDSSDFAPLFKNIIKYALIPASDSFEVRDLAFILNTNLKINELPENRVIDIAKDVKRLRFSGAEDDQIALLLRRTLEGDKLTFAKDIKEALDREGIAKVERERAMETANIFVEQFRITRKAELRDKYDKELRNNRILLGIIPLIIAICTIFLFIFSLQDEKWWQIGIGILINIITDFAFCLPFNKKFVKKHSEYITNIDQVVEKEILEKKQQISYTR